jgi:hypothetical protein
VYSPSPPQLARFHPCIHRLLVTDMFWPPTITPQRLVRVGCLRASPFISASTAKLDFKQIGSLFAVTYETRRPKWEWLIQIEYHVCCSFDVSLSVGSCCWQLLPPMRPISKFAWNACLGVSSCCWQLLPPMRLISTFACSVCLGVGSCCWQLLPPMRLMAKYSCVYARAFGKYMVVGSHCWRPLFSKA